MPSRRHTHVNWLLLRSWLAERGYHVRISAAGITIENEFTELQLGECYFG